MDFLKAIFSFRGRIGRSDFWILTLILLAAFVIAWAVHAIDLPGRQIIAVLLVLAGFIAWLSAAVRRLHDRDKSAWYLLLFFGAPSVLQNATREAAGGSRETFSIYFFSGGVGSVIDLICLAIGIWMIAELGFLRGTSEQNRFGFQAPLFSD